MLSTILAPVPTFPVLELGEMTAILSGPDKDRGQRGEPWMDCCKKEILKPQQSF